MEGRDEIILHSKLKDILDFFNYQRTIRFHLHKDLKELHNKIEIFLGKLEK